MAAALAVPCVGLCPEVSACLTARVSMSRACASIERLWLAACMRNRCLTGSSRFRMVRVVFMRKVNNT